MVEERRRFLQHLKEQGYVRTSLRVRSVALLRLAELSDLFSGPGPISKEEISKAILDWMDRNPGRVRSRRGCHTNLVRVAIQWLQFLGKLEPEGSKRKQITSPDADVLMQYLNHLKLERGLKPLSIRLHQMMVRDFLEWLNHNKNVMLQNLISNHVDEYIQFCSVRLSHSSMTQIASQLRSFFRFCEKTGMFSWNLSGILRGPRLYRFEQIPYGPSWEQIQKLLSHPYLSTSRGIRDRGILLFLAVYGLRSREVVQLKLDDIDWVSQTIQIERAKTGRRQTFPLTQETGDAIIQYLKEVRPKNTKWRELFLRRQAPIGPISASNIGQMTKEYFRRTGFAPAWGPHALRHACATHLLRQELSLKEIADHLGHEKIQSTRIYAKVDLKGLRQLAEFDPLDSIARAALDSAFSGKGARI